MFEAAFNLAEYRNRVKQTVLPLDYEDILSVCK